MSSTPAIYKDPARPVPERVRDLLARMTPQEKFAQLHAFWLVLSESGEHHDFGGLLLRRDVHRLFDNGRIAVDPETDLLDVDPGLDAYPVYAELHGKPLALALRPEHRVWLTAHWNAHRAGS